MRAKMIKMHDEKTNTKFGTQRSFHFRAELKSGFQSLIINDDQHNDA